MDSVLDRPLFRSGFWLNLLGLLLALAAGGLTIIFPLADTLLLFVLLGLAVGTTVEPLIGLVGGLALGLLRAYLQTEVPWIPAQIGHLFIALSAVAWVAHGLLRRDLHIPLFSHRNDLQPTRTLSPTLPLIGFIAAAGLSLWNSIDLLNYGLPEFAKWLEILLVLWILFDRAQPKHLPWILAGVLLVGIGQASVGIYQFALRGDGPDHFLIPGTDFYRAYGTFEQPNPYAGYIGITLALATGILATNIWDGRVKKTAFSRYSLALLPVLAALAIALGASWSRGAWIGFAAALVPMAIALPRRPQRGLFLVGLLVIVALVLYTTDLLPSAITARLTNFAANLRLEDVRGVGINDANYAVIERLAHWQAALEMWQNRFWVGVGLGCYEPAYPQFALINWPIPLGHAHNIYLNLLAETGLLGAIAYLALWASIFWQTWRAAHHASGLARGAAVGLLGAWTHLTIHHLFDNLYVNNVHLLIGILLGLLFILNSTTHKTQLVIQTL